MALAACGGGIGPATDGPLSGGPYGAASIGNVCAPARLGQQVAFGIERFTNHGNGTVVLDRVALRHPHNERLIGSYAVPGPDLIGLEYWPPNYPGLPSSWKYRRPAHGFRLAPGKTFTMVLDVAATALGQPDMQGMAIYYHDAAGSYVTSNDFALEIGIDKSSC
jgi:hypothetical protein